MQRLFISQLPFEPSIFKATTLSRYIVVSSGGSERETTFCGISQIKTLEPTYGHAIQEFFLHIFIDYMYFKQSTIVPNFGICTEKIIGTEKIQKDTER